MDIIKEINEHWNPEHGCSFHIQKGDLNRMIVIHPWNKWDVWGYHGDFKRPNYRVVLIRCLLRRDGTVDPNIIIREWGKELNIPLEEYLQDWKVVNVKRG